MDAQCKECGQTFDLTNEEEANEWFNGHDCEENQLEVRDVFQIDQDRMMTKAADAEMGDY